VTEYTDFHIGPQAPVSALRQDLPYISFDPLGDVATIAVVEGGDGCQASAQLVDVASRRSRMGMDVRRPRPLPCLTLSSMAGRRQRTFPQMISRRSRGRMATYSNRRKLISTMWTRPGLPCPAR